MSIARSFAQALGLRQTEDQPIDVVGVVPPEGVVAAGLGSRYTDKSAGELWIKTSGGTTSTGWSQVSPITALQIVVGMYREALPTEIVASTKTPRIYNRSTGTWSITGAYLDLDTAGSGTPTAVIRKNGSATGAVTVTVQAAALSGNAAASLSIAPGDYIQCWITDPGGGATDAVVTVVGTEA